MNAGGVAHLQIRQFGKRWWHLSKLVEAQCTLAQLMEVGDRLGEGTELVVADVQQLWGGVLVLQVCGLEDGIGLEGDGAG